MQTFIKYFPIEISEETDEAASRRRRLQELPTEVELEVKSIERLLEAQRVAAETITNICSSDDDGKPFKRSLMNYGDLNFCSTFLTEWADDDNDENSDAESVHDYENSNNSSTNLQNIDRLPVDILEAIKSLGLIEKVSEINGSQKGLKMRDLFLTILSFSALAKSPADT